jgi:hypothetical protein
MGAAKKKKNTRDTKRKGKKQPLRRGEKKSGIR